MKKRGPSKAMLIREYTGHDPSGFPRRFNAILANEIEILRPPLTTWMYPFSLTHPSAVEDEYLQVGLCDYLFTNIDYALIRFLFGISDPSKLKKSRLKAWLVAKCDVSPSELAECSWSYISERSLCGIESAGELIGAGRFNFNTAQAIFDGRDLELPSNGPVLVLEKLADSIGRVVPHKDLDPNSNSSSASDNLKGHIATIRKAFSRHKVPYAIAAKRGVGYVLRQT